jgi:hypothetical protein
MFNRKHSQESIEKIRRAMTGKKKSKETMVKISEALSRKLNRKQNRNRSFLGHIFVIYDSVSKYSKEWKLPCSEWDNFKEWTVDDPTYEELFKQWKESNYDNNLSPVAMRGVKKNGFVIENLTWKMKGEFSWWGEEKALRDQIERDLNEEQKVLNKRDKTWQEKTKEQIKNLKKKRR